MTAIRKDSWFNSISILLDIGGTYHRYFSTKNIGIIFGTEELPSTVKLNHLIHTWRPEVLWIDLGIVDYRILNDKLLLHCMPKNILLHSKETNNRIVKSLLVKQLYTKVKFIHKNGIIYWYQYTRNQCKP